MSSTHDQKWTTDPNDPSSLQSACDDNCLVRFLLGVEEGVFLGTNGWDPAYERPLGNPLGPAVYTAAVSPATSSASLSLSSSAYSPATLHRNFTSGTFVQFTYNKAGTDGRGEIWWGGHPPAPPAPAPPAPTIRCGSCGSTLLNDTTFGHDDVGVQTAATAAACCAHCAADAACVQWAWHGPSRGQGAAGAEVGEEATCHLHGTSAVEKGQRGTVSGVMNRTAGG